MGTSGRRFRHAFVACLVVVLGLVLASAAHADTFAGRAFAAAVRTLPFGGGTVYYADTGELPSEGGWEPAGLAGAGGSTLSANLMTASTSGAHYDGQGSKVNGSTSLVDLVVLPGTPAALTANFVRAQSRVTADVIEGSSEIDGLVFGGLPVNVTGAPNQRVDIPGVATLIINEQTVTSAGPVREIRVNALHLILAMGGGEVILSSARSAINSAE